MAKKNFKKYNNVGKANKAKQEMKEMIERGQTLGNTIIDILSLVATDWRGLGAAAIGMAKAISALRCVADEEGVAIDDLYESKLRHYEDHFADLIYMEKQKEKKN